MSRAPPLRPPLLAPPPPPPPPLCPVFVPVAAGFFGIQPAARISSMAAHRIIVLIMVPPAKPQAALMRADQRQRLDLGPFLDVRLELRAELADRVFDGPAGAVG